jgi:Cu+-exporting ATPase
MLPEAAMDLMTTTTPKTTDNQSAEASDLNFNVAGMNCASCVSHVQKAARALPGVKDVNVSLALGRATVNFDPHAVSPEKIASAITDAGYPTTVPQDATAAHAEHERVEQHAAHARGWARRALVGTALWLPVEATHWVLTFSYGAHAGHADFGWMNWVALVASTVSIIYVGWAFYKSAIGALLRGTSNMDTLIAMGATVAYVYSLVAFFGYLTGAWSTLPNLYFMEAAGLLALISIGHWLEARARDAAGSAIRELMNLAPATALRLGENDHPTEVPVSELRVGDAVLVRPGDRVSTDGVVSSGKSSVDESLITGESIPVVRTVGDEVIAGTVNLDGHLIVRVTRTGSETALAQIIKLVDAAQSSKPPVQKLADRVAAVFVPSVLAIAALTGIGWYLWGWHADWETGHTWGQIANAVCSVLIIACPCALGLAVPAALMVGTGRGARKGILIRDIDALQNAETIDTVVLDKTGTLTEGRPAVVRVVPQNGLDENGLLTLAAAAEQFSEHPVAKAIVLHARNKAIALPEPESFANEPGLGVRAQITGRKLLVGSDALLQLNPDAAQQIAPKAGETFVHVGEILDGQVKPLGLIVLTDELKADSVDAVRAFHALNLRTVLLSGDNELTARAIADRVGIDDVRANVRPAGKVQVIRELQKNSRVAMVGDGINDAPALAAADLGIAVGSATDVAKEAGGIVLVGNSLRGAVAAIRLSRATMRTIRQNLFFAFIYNVLAIPLAALGLLNPLIAAAMMALSDVTVLGNALRLRRTRID